MELDNEKEIIQSFARSCLLEINKLKLAITELEVEKANDNSPLRIQQLEQDVVAKEKEVSVIKFQSEEEISNLRKQLEEKDLLIKNQEDRIYELDYVNNSLDEIKEYFADQLREYKKKELSDVNRRLNESFKCIAEKEAQISTLSRTIDEYKIKLIKLEDNAEFKDKIVNLEKEIESKNNEINTRDNQISLLKEQTIPREDYVNLQSHFENEISSMDDEVNYLKHQTIPKQDYINLQTKLEKEISAMDNEINLLKQQSVPREDYVKMQTRFENELAVKDSEIKYLKEISIPKDDYLDLQNEINVMDNEIRYIKEQSVPREDYINLKNELNRKNEKIQRLEELNTFFNELKEEQEAYETMDNTPPFRLEKKQPR